jgi:hypothetical protein
MTQSVGDAFPERLPAHRASAARARPTASASATSSCTAAAAMSSSTWCGTGARTFGLQSGGRTESILLSMPPLVGVRHRAPFALVRAGHRGFRNVQPADQGSGGQRARQGPRGRLSQAAHRGRGKRGMDHRRLRRRGGARHAAHHSHLLQPGGNLGRQAGASEIRRRQAAGQGRSAGAEESCDPHRPHAVRLRRKKAAGKTPAKAPAKPAARRPTGEAASTRRKAPETVKSGDKAVKPSAKRPSVATKTAVTKVVVPAAAKRASAKKVPAKNVAAKRAPARKPASGKA